MLRILFLSALLFIVATGAPDGEKADLTITVNDLSVHVSCDGPTAVVGNGNGNGKDEDSEISEHPRPGEACAFLDKINGRLDELEIGAKPCTREMNPQNVTIVGMYGGKPVEFEQGYGNPCLMRAAGEALFDIRPKKTNKGQN